MKFIKKFFNFLKCNRENKDYREFEEINDLLVLSRIRYISFAVAFLSIILFYFDFVVLKDLDNIVYKTNLIVLHSIGIIASIAYLLLHKKIVERKHIGKYNIISIVTKIYVFSFVLLGILHSINSQLFTGNIYTYIIMAFSSAIILNIKPCYMLLTFGINHIIFLISVNNIINNPYDFATKAMNSSIMIVIAWLMSFSFYKFKIDNFVNNKKLQESEENFKKLFHINPFPIFVTRLDDGKILKYSDKAGSFFGLTHDELNNSYLKDFYIKEEDRLQIIDKLKRNSSINNYIVEYNIKGNKRWILANYDLIEYQGTQCILAGVMDITEKKKADEKLAKYASTDVLTGINNRRAGLKVIQDLIDESKNTFKEFVICFIDINNLKIVNDAYGHGEGDNYIKFFCDLVSEELEQDDIFFRLGGDEFIIIFKNKDISTVEAVWENILNSFNKVNVKAEKPYTITASHGLSHFKSGMDVDPEQIINMADKQMYKEKLLYKHNLH